MPITLRTSSGQFGADLIGCLISMTCGFLASLLAFAFLPMARKSTTRLSTVQNIAKNECGDIDSAPGKWKSKKQPIRRRIDESKIRYLPGGYRDSGRVPTRYCTPLVRSRI